MSLGILHTNTVMISRPMMNCKEEDYITDEDLLLFEEDIDEDIYTLRKTSYKKGKADYPKWEPNPNWDVERLIQYKNGWSYSEWCTLDTGH